MQLLPLIAWIINTTSSSALPRGSTPYKIWFGRQPPADFQEYKTRAILGGNSEGLGERSGEGLGEEDTEEGLFIDEDIEVEQEQEEMILSELTKRVAEHVRKQKENMVKRASAKALEYEAQEIATLQIPKQYRFGTESVRIPVRVLEKTAKVRNLLEDILLLELTIFRGIA
jgi:hypothetical protein